VCVAVGVVSAVPALADVASLLGIVSAQLRGAAHGTDFLNLYASAYLVLHDPSRVYDLEAQLAVQRGLTGWQSPIVPFFLPPYAALPFVLLALLPYGAAYALWLLLNGACLAGSALLLAPRWGGRWSPLVWLGLALVFLPAFLGLVQGQTSALMLLAFACLVRLWGSSRSWALAACTLVWLIKPQLALPLLVALLLARRFDVLPRLAGLLAVLSAAALVVLTPSGFALYVRVALGKFGETMAADPSFLPGATLLAAAHWFFGLNWPAHVLGFVLVGAAWLAFALIWRTDSTGARLAAIPVLAIAGAPYALVHELTTWLAAFWLLWGMTHDRPAARAALLWLTVAVWIAGDVGVIAPLHGGAAIAALLGLILLWTLRRLAPMFRVHYYAWSQGDHCASDRQSSQPRS
jgi:hypothetical protein